MAAAAAEVVLEVLPQPPPPLPLPRREPAGAVRDLVLPRVVQYLHLASTWVGCACVAASTVTRRVLSVDSPVAYAFLEVSIGSLVVTVLALVLLTLRLLRVMCAVGFRSSLRTSAREIQFQIQSRKMFGGLTWKVLRNPAVLVMLATFILLLLIGAGALVLGGLLPVEESQREKIGYALFDTGALGTMAMFCFVIIPSFALKVWKSK